jgi:hypothetical protein
MPPKFINEIKDLGIFGGPHLSAGADSRLPQKQKIQRNQRSAMSAGTDNFSRPHRAPRTRFSD